MQALHGLGASWILTGCWVDTGWCQFILWLATGAVMANLWLDAGWIQTHLCATCVVTAALNRTALCDQLMKRLRRSDDFTALCLCFLADGGV